MKAIISRTGGEDRVPPWKGNDLKSRPGPLQSHLATSLFSPWLVLRENHS